MCQTKVTLLQQGTPVLASRRFDDRKSIFEQFTTIYQYDAPVVCIYFNTILKITIIHQHGYLNNNEWYLEGNYFDEKNDTESQEDQIMSEDAPFITPQESNATASTYQVEKNSTDSHEEICKFIIDFSNGDTTILENFQVTDIGYFRETEELVYVPARDIKYTKCRPCGYVIKSTLDDFIYFKNIAKKL